MNYFEGETFSEIFAKIRPAILNAPEVCPRGQRTKELHTAVIKLTNPEQRLFYHPKRNFNLLFAIVDSCMLFNGSREVKYLKPFNRNIAQFSDDGVTLNSMYGQYINVQLQGVIRKLMHDPDTRQAVITIYDGKRWYNQDAEESKDVQCTLNLHFTIRDKKLNLTVYMRSNDLIWGLQYDLFVFTSFQQVVANELGIKVGDYYHVDTSLHVYEKHWELLDSMSETQPVGFTIEARRMHMFANCFWIMNHVDNEEIPLEYPFDTYGRILYHEFIHRRYKTPLVQTEQWAIPFLTK